MNPRISALVAIGSLAIAFFGCAVLSSSHAAVVYSAVDDFNVGTNPNGVWSYREGVNSATLLSRVSSGPSVESWSGSNPTIYGFFPYVARNVSGGTLPVNWTVDLLQMHPSESLIPSVVRWTAPLSGTWKVQGSFVSLSSGLTDINIYKNTSSIVSGSLSGTGSPAVTINQDIDLSAGDFLEFAVGAQGNWGGDGVGFKATITSASTPAVPEPSSMAIAASLGIGCFIRLRRRRALHEEITVAKCGDDFECDSRLPG
ncbi:MAG: hypothetical protein KGS49_08370 [Planctomycetes bacterium]|nr:hypothetical protein [Planctomycetota bacterium]